MNPTRSTLLWTLAGLCLVVGVPFLGKWSRRHAEPRCALDGLQIDPNFRVRLVEGPGEARDFCCIRCAERWLWRRPDAVNAILVADEASGEMFDARLIHFVHSPIATNPFTSNRVHAFRSEADAAAHAAAFDGQELLGSERPFDQWRRGAQPEAPTDNGP